MRCLWANLARPGALPLRVTVYISFEPSMCPRDLSVKRAPDRRDEADSKVYCRVYVPRYRRQQLMPLDARGIPSMPDPVIKPARYLQLAFSSWPASCALELDACGSCRGSGWLRCLLMGRAGAPSALERSAAAGLLCAQRAGGEASAGGSPCALRLLRRWALIYDGVRECVEAGERDEQVFGQAEARQRGTRVANGHVRHRLTTPLALAQRCPQAPKLTRAPSLAGPAAEGARPARDSSPASDGISTH